MLFASGATCQYWSALGNGIKNSPGSLYVLYGDSVWDVLLFGGTVKCMIDGPDSVLIRGTAQWDGTAWDSLPASLDPCCLNNLFGVFRYQGFGMTYTSMAISLWLTLKALFRGVLVAGIVLLGSGSRWNV